MNKKPLLSIALLALILATASCRPDRIRDNNPQPSYQEYVFDEEFNNDRNGWGFADQVNYAYGVVSNGTFKFDYNDNYSDVYYAAKFFGFNPYNDFSIAARIGSDNNMGVLFGYDDQNNTYGYSFMVDYDGNYYLYDEGGNGYGPNPELLVGPETGNFVNAYGDWNDIKIVQSGNRWLGYINGVQVFNIDAQNMNGSGIGFVDAAQTHGEADYLEVHWYE